MGTDGRAAHFREKVARERELATFSIYAHTPLTQGFDILLFLTTLTRLPTFPPWQPSPGVGNLLPLGSPWPRGRGTPARVWRDRNTYVEGVKTRVTAAVNGIMWELHALLKQAEKPALARVLPLPRSGAA